MSGDEIIWVMDSDICDECGGLLDDFGICSDCGYDGVEWDEYDEYEDYAAMMGDYDNE